MATLPGDPMEDMNIRLGCDDVCGLEENGMLHMKIYWIIFCILLICSMRMQMRLTIVLVGL